jgi:hypothetical protein
MELSLTGRARRYLAALPPAIAGSRGHDATFKAACALIHGFSLDVSASLPILSEWNDTHCTPRWTEAQLRHKLCTAARSVPQRGAGYLLKKDATRPHASTRQPVRRSPQPPPDDFRWPRRDLDAIRRIAQTGLGGADLYHSSPIYPGEMDAEDYIDALFPGNPLLCVGDRMEAAETRHRLDLRGTLSRRQFIVPSVMSAPEGRTQEGRPSPRTLTNVGERSYVVVECDFAFTTRDGTPTPEAALLRELEATRISVFDLCAAVLHWLARVAPLALVVSSGGKSYHGWFPRQGQSEDKLRRFMRLAVTIGADYHTWTPCQFVRMPEGRRDNGRLQAVQFFNPSVIR